MKWRCKMDKQKLISTIKQEFMLKRCRAQEQAEMFLEELKKDEYFNDTYTKMMEVHFKKLKCEIELEKNKLANEFVLLRNKVEKYLTEHNIDKSKLTPKYDCLKCNDTGVYKGKICDCLLNEMNRKLTFKACSQTEFKDFSKCDLSIMNEGDKKTYNFLKTWCEKYPDVTKLNINIMGGAGVGKTFLLECVATEMIKKNQVVCYKTAFELNELARLYHIGKSYEFADCLNADILLIDDLGTEPILKNVTKEYLYNLINVRQINKRPTFITTNLGFDNIISRYDERIFSRLGNKNISINIELNSVDKRIK